MNCWIDVCMLEVENADVTGYWEQSMLVWGGR